MSGQDQSMDHLVEVACGRDPSASLAAARELGALPEPGRFEAMAAVLSGANSLVCELAADAMESYGERGLSELIEALPRAKPLSQVKIIAAMERMGRPRAAESLMDLLRRTDVTMVRTLAIQALGRIGAVQAAPLIRSFAEDDDHHVRERVRLALEALEGGR